MILKHVMCNFVGEGQQLHKPTLILCFFVFESAFLANIDFPVVIFCLEF